MGTRTADLQTASKQNHRQNDWRTRASQVTFESRPFINGDYTQVPHQTKSSGVFLTENPATAETLAEFTDSSTTTVDSAVAAARAAFQTWRLTSPEQRKAILLAVADRIAAARDSFALLDCLEMGMPIVKARQKADIAAHYLRYYAECLDKHYSDVAPADPTSTLAFNLAEPRGVVGVIAPWNSPLVVAVSAIAPALAAGNTAVLKPSEQTPSSILKFAEIATQAGLPAGVLNIVPGLGLTTGAALASHKDVDLLHFTGSTQVGRQLMQYAGQSNGKPLMLEMGGKSPQIVFEDAAALPNLGGLLAQSAFVNSGQLCVAKTRLLVHKNCKDAIVSALEQETKQHFRIGCPLDEQTTFGPIASRKQFDRIQQYLAVGEGEGAKPRAIPMAGDMPTTGYFLQATAFDQVDHRMRIAQEEIFGPVLSIITFNTDDEAIQLANSVDYGLAATAWTQDLNRARRLARELQAGSVDICATTEAPAASSGLSGEPFGASGFGVVGGLRGLGPYTRLKAVQIVTA